MNAPLSMHPSVLANHERRQSTSMGAVNTESSGRERDTEAIAYAEVAADSYFPVDKTLRNNDHTKAFADSHFPVDKTLRNNHHPSPIAPLRMKNNSNVLTLLRHLSTILAIYCEKYLHKWGKHEHYAHTLKIILTGCPRYIRTRLFFPLS